MNNDRAFDLDAAVNFRLQKAGKINDAALACCCSPPRT
jgi:hypothetical protein